MRTSDDGVITPLPLQTTASAEALQQFEATKAAKIAATEALAVAAANARADEDLRLLADSALDFAMIFTDENRLIIRWSAGAESVLGWTEAEVIGRRDFDLIFTEEDKATGVPQQEQNIALRDGRATDERWHVTKDGTRFWAVGVMTPIYDRATGDLRGFGKVLRNMDEQKRLEAVLQHTNEELEARVAERTQALRDLTHRLVISQEEERQRLSRELHDQTGQHLTGLSLLIGSLRDTYPPDDASRLLLDRIDRATDALARDIHRIAVELRPPALDDLGLIPALGNYIGQWSERTGIDAEFENTGMEGVRLPGLAEITVYRVVQEALNNVAKHAARPEANPRASFVSVTLQQRGEQQGPAEVQVAIEDDGPGFDAEAATRVGRLGIAGMRERADSCGGTIAIESALGAGTTVFLRVPIED